MQEKYLKESGTWELNPLLTFAAINSDFPVRDFCLVIQKEILNRICQLHLLNVMCVVRERQQWKHKQKKGNFKVFCSFELHLSISSAALP